VINLTNFKVLSNLYICPTPIGNLQDISARVLDTLETVDVIYCEDTRRARKLIENFSISTPLKSYFVGNEKIKIAEIEKTLSEGKNVALISDAGTPLISDPGNDLIQHLIINNFNIISIPGPSSVLTALTLSGFELNEFQFLGFVPKVSKEKKVFIVKLLNSQMPSVCFTSPKRLLKDLIYFEKEGLDSEIVICRELTKKFETIYRGNINSIKNQISENLKGEITIVVGPSKNDKKIDLDIDSAVKILLDQKVPKREIAKSLSFVTAMSVNELYEKIKDF
tara:strand:- start:168 stop:1007 length:840 start_codon:yes stop_codon:yes gene_type:complete